MAINGSMVTGSSNGRSIRFDWWVNRQDISGNYTEIGWNLVGDGTYTGTNNQGWIACGPFDLWIAGTQFYKSDRLHVKKGDVVNSGTHILYHDNSGNCTFTAAMSCAVSSSSINVSTGDHSWPLPTIPRQANVTGYWDFNDEQNPTITFNNPGGFRINARLEFSGVNIRRDNISNTGSYTFSLTDAERKLLRQKCNGNSITVRGVIATCIGGTTENYWSYWDRTMTIVNGNPTFSNFTFEDVNSKTFALTGNNQNVIKGYSNIKVTIPVVNKATAKKEATMSKYRFTSGDKNSPDSMLYSETDAVVGTINGTPNGTLNVYAIDSRNNSTLVTKLANQVIDYTPLTKGEIEIGRNNGVSEQVTLKFNGLINVINFGVKTNAIKSAKFRYRSTETGSEWSIPESLDVIVNDSTFLFEGLVKGDTEGLGFNVANSYEIEVIVEDELSSVTYTDKFGSGTPNLALAKQGTGIMGPYDEEVGGKFQVGGKCYDKNIMTIFSTSRFDISGTEKRLTKLTSEISVGDKLTLSNSSIKIGKGVKKVLVSATISWWMSTKYYQTRIEIRNQSNKILARAWYETREDQYTTDSMHVTPFLTEVNEGDEISLWFGNGSDLSVGILGDARSTFLTVEVVE